jgi:hypothetical protein
MKAVIASMLLFLAITPMTYAKNKAYKCAHNGKILYSESPCDSPATLESSQSTARIDSERVKQIQDSVRRKEYPSNYYDSGQSNIRN